MTRTEPSYGSQSVKCRMAAGIPRHKRTPRGRFGPPWDYRNMPQQLYADTGPGSSFDIL